MTLLISDWLKVHLHKTSISVIGLPRGHRCKESICQYRRLKRHGLDIWVGRISWSRKRQPTPIFLPGKYNGQRTLVSYSPWGPKSWTQWNTHTHQYDLPSVWTLAPRSQEQILGSLCNINFLLPMETGEGTIKFSKLF